MGRFTVVLTFDTTVASASCSIICGNWLIRLLLFGVCTGHVLGLLFRLGLWNVLFGSAIHDLAALHAALDQPVVIVQAMLATMEALGTEIVVSTFTEIAVIMLIEHILVALVAIDRPGICGT
jgi:hypothetical protein